MFYRSDHLRSHVIRPAGRSERSERFTFLSPIPPSGRNGTSERKREREVSERPASQSPPVATVCLRHPVTTVDD